MRAWVAELKDNINTMIDNLRLTTDRNTEQDWLKTNLARFHQHVARDRRDLQTVGRVLLTELTPLGQRATRVIYSRGRRAAVSHAAVGIRLRRRARPLSRNEFGRGVDRSMRGRQAGAC